jgi:hypothetical protein
MIATLRRELPWNPRSTGGKTDEVIEVNADDAMDTARHQDFVDQL